jgi:cyanophycinase
MAIELKAGALTWRSGAGWLVLIGGTSDQWRATEAIDRAAIELMDRDRPIAFVPAAACPPDYGESFLATYRGLGAPPGYVVPVHDRASASDPANTELLRRAGLIYFGGGETVQLLGTLTGTPALEAVAAAHDAGAVVVGMSAGAIALAALGVPLNLSIGVLQGWGWLARAIVSVHHTPERHPGLRKALIERPEMLGIGLPEDAALALGPKGQLQTWGARELTVTAGPDFEPND